MQPLMSKAEFLELAVFDQRLERVKDAGGRVPPAQADFLRDALYEGYRAAMGRHPKAMSPRQRNLKKSYFDALRSSVADFEGYFVLVHSIYQAPAWLKRKDLERVVSKSQLAEIVSNLCTILDKEYADSVLSAISRVFATKGERIQIVRDAA